MQVRIFVQLEDPDGTVHGGGVEAEADLTRKPGETPTVGDILWAVSLAGDVVETLLTLLTHTCTKHKEARRPGELPPELRN